MVPTAYRQFWRLVPQAQVPSRAVHPPFCLRRGPESGKNGGLWESNPLDVW